MIKKEFAKLNWQKRFVYLKDIVFDEKDLKQKGAKFQIVRFLPKTKIKPHFHKKVNEIFYIKEGRGIIVFNGKRQKVKKDDIFLCQPLDVHEIINDYDKELVILIFKTNENPDDIHWQNKK